MINKSAVQAGRRCQLFSLGRVAALGLLALGVGCSDVKDIIDLSLNPPQRETIDVTKVGVNNFFLGSDQFGSISSQWRDIRENLGIKHVRILFAWTDSVQATPETVAVVDFYDTIIRNIPADADVVVTVAHAPAWMANPANWIDGDPIKTWVERWFRPLVRRYRGQRGISGWQIWNEPNKDILPSDAAFGFEDPARYFRLLQLASQVVREEDPGKLVVLAATTSINQSFPIAFRYNKDLRGLGAEQYIDVWSIHYYGKNYETVVQSGGIEDFVNSLQSRIWVTESGEQGVDKQLAYAETTWPFLLKEMGQIERIYQYQYAEAGVSPGSTFGLRNTDSATPVSDLYVHFVERRKSGS